jgi:predicted ATPase/DNA-binding CsgD family transcriptional regulator
MDNQKETPVSEPLSNRELDILRLLAQGLSNQEIAERLILSLETVKWYNKQIYSKLGVNSRTKAVARAREEGLFDIAHEEPYTPPSSTGHNLPAQITPFIGRQRELAEVQELLETNRLVTLTGAGGTGKTRLALQVAEAAVAKYPDGLTFVSLVSTLDPDRVANTIGYALGVTERPNSSLVESIQRFFRNNKMLLVIDNYEHVLAAAPLVAELLAAAPQLTILTTSREVLRLHGEYEYLVPPLTVPVLFLAESAADLSNYESVSLFVQRAQAALTGFHLTDENASAVAAICLRLDGLPLAIELAAARVKLFSLQQLLKRLENRLGLLTSGSRDMPARQRTLRDTIDWSYNLLEPEEQQLFARLAVFLGGRTIEAIEAICGPDLSFDPLDGLESLLNKNLLYQEEGPGDQLRFFMLETIHEYAWERLVNSGEEQITKDRHLEYFLSLVEEMEPGYRGHNQVILLNRTQAEMSNLRAAFDWAMKRGNFEDAARLVSAIDYYLKYRDGLVEGYRLLNQVLDSSGEIPQVHRARFMLAIGRLAWVNGDLSLSEKFCRQALDLSVELGDRLLEAWSLVEYAGALDVHPEDHEEAFKLFERGIRLFKELGDKPGLAQGLNSLGELARSAHDYDLAKEIYEEALKVCQETGEVYRQSMLWANLAFIAYDEGDYEHGRELAIRITKQRLEIGWKEWSFTGLMVLAGPLARLGQPEKAARLLGASATLLNSIGVLYQPGDLPEVAKYISDVQTQLDEATFEAVWAEGQAMTFEQAVTYALSES